MEKVKAKIKEIIHNETKRKESMGENQLIRNKATKNEKKKTQNKQKENKVRNIQGDCNSLFYV